METTVMNTTKQAKKEPLFKKYELLKITLLTAESYELSSSYTYVLVFNQSLVHTGRFMGIEDGLNRGNGNGTKVEFRTSRFEGNEGGYTYVMSFSRELDLKNCKANIEKGLNRYEKAACIHSMKEAVASFFFYLKKFMYLRM